LRPSNKTTKTTQTTKEETMKMYNKALALFATVFLAIPAMAQEVAPALASSVGSTVGLVALGVGLMMGLAVLGGTLGQSRAAATALDGIARNPAASDKFTVPLVLSLALMESLVLFAFLIGLFLQGSISTALNVVK